MANQMVRTKLPPLSAAALSMLGKAAASRKPVTPADLFNVSNVRAWDTLQVLAGRYLVEVEGGTITVTKAGQSALRAGTSAAKKAAKGKAPRAAQTLAQGKAAKRSRQPVRFS